MKIRTVAFLVAVLAMAGCGKPQNKGREHRYTYNVVTYYQDPRADTCFAIIETFYEGNYVETVTTSVPCSEKVIAIAKYYGNNE
jgi:hypothetical protein